jgi:hypothetical protein
MIEQQTDAEMARQAKGFSEPITFAHDCVGYLGPAPEVVKEESPAPQEEVAKANAILSQMQTWPVLLLLDADGMTHVAEEHAPRKGDEYATYQVIDDRTRVAVWTCVEVWDMDGRAHRLMVRKGVVGIYGMEG